MRQISDLLFKHLQGRLSEKERKVLDSWRSESAENQRLFDQINDRETLEDWLEIMHNADEQRIWQEIVDRRKKKGVFRNTLSSRWLNAAAILLLILTTTYLYLSNRKHTESKTIVIPLAKVEDFGPGTNKAILTLSDGSGIVLDSSSQGKLANEGRTNIVKTSGGSIAYQGIDEREHFDVYNSLQTPRGGQYQVTLSDGTRVWLNAASSIRYPVKFRKGERNVSITGEVYFEVAHNASSPFVVSIDDKARVFVLGTHFNIKSYREDSAIATTLLQGSVRVNNILEDSIIHYSEVFLNPGEQVRFNADLRRTVKIYKSVNTAGIMAWKDGKFDLENKSLREIMRELARWYDLQIEYAPGFEDTEFGGDVPMNFNLAQVLKVLEGAGVHFRLEQPRKLIMLP